MGIDDILGPSYNYPDQIASPDSLRVGPGKTVRAVRKNITALRIWAEHLVTHPAIGNNFFLRSGQCNEDSVEECRGKPRYVYIRNKPTGDIPCIGDSGISFDCKGSARGILVGMIDDMVQINPLDIATSMAGINPKISKKCVLKTRNVTDKAGSRMETKCAPEVDTDQCILSLPPPGKETGGGRQPSPEEFIGDRMLSRIDNPIPTTLASHSPLTVKHLYNVVQNNISSKKNMTILFVFLIMILLIRYFRR